MIGKKHKADEPDKAESAERDVAEQPPGLRVDEIAQGDLDEIITERDRLSTERDRYLRAAADAENRVRTARKDLQEQYRQGVSAVAREVIAALDSFDLALAQDMNTASVESIIQGVSSIRDELIRALARRGMSLIQPGAGDELDPMRHQAMMEQPTTDIEPGKIVAMVQVGYTLDDRVIRPAKVIVAKGLVDEAQADACAEATDVQSVTDAADDLACAADADDGSEDPNPALASDDTELPDDADQNRED